MIAIENALVEHYGLSPAEAAAMVRRNDYFIREWWGWGIGVEMIASELIETDSLPEFSAETKTEIAA